MFIAIIIFTKCYDVCFVGPFLEALFSKLENMPEQDFRINLRLTAVITRLSIYNKPLIQSLLLNHSMIFQPCIRSLFQVCIPNSMFNINIYMYMYIL